MCAYVQAVLRWCGAGLSAAGMVVLSVGLLITTGCGSTQTPAVPAIFGVNAGWPGTAPGAAVLTGDGARMTAGNAVISIEWALAPQGIRMSAIRDEQSGQQIDGRGELFRIVLSDGRSYAASALAAEGPPRITTLEPDSNAARLARRISGQQVELRLRSADGALSVVWRAVLHDGSNYVRQELETTLLQSGSEALETVWLDEPDAGAVAAGRVEGSPVTLHNFFFAAESPHAVTTDGRLPFRLRRAAPVRMHEPLTQSCVIGTAPQDQMRRAFLYYLERERAHPFRTFLHYNSWYDISWLGELFDEAEALETIRLFGERFITPHGVVMDALVLDDGWDEVRTPWQFHKDLPNGFTPLADLCRSYNTRLGVWLSPFGGYGKVKKQRLEAGRALGYEINAAGFSLAGPKYYAVFKQACVDMIRTYGVNYFKFDGIANGSYNDGAADYILDTEAMQRLMLELRTEDPNLYINLTTGSWPSPFWLRYADSIWRQGRDMGVSGKGSRQQQWLTYRDQETFRNIVGKGPLYPLNSLMTQGVAYSRFGMAGDSTYNSAGFKEDVRAFFGSGTGLQELYIRPDRLTADDWSVLAEAAKWSRANADVFVDTHWIGGDPGMLEVYGYASWTPRKGILMLRNPDDQPREFALDVGAAFELPDGAPEKFTLKSPWVEDAARPALTAEAGRPVRVALQPFEVLILDAVTAK